MSILEVFDRHLYVIRWRPLEGAFAAVGSQAEVILDISNDEHDAGRPRPIDIEYLLVSVIPSLITLSGAWSAVTKSESKPD
jgi:hypothetical protein